DMQARNREQVVQARLVYMVLPVAVHQRFVSKYHRRKKSRWFRVQRSLCPQERLLPEEFDSASYRIQNPGFRLKSTAGMTCRRFGRKLCQKPFVLQMTL